MSLKIHKYNDLSAPIPFYNGTVRLRFSPKSWLYLIEEPNGDLTPLRGVTGTLKKAGDKSPMLVPWACNLFYEKALALLQACRRGDFVEVEYDDLVHILQQGKVEHKTILDAAGSTGHEAHSFVESLVVATMAEDENRRLEILSKFPEDERATNAAVAALAFYSDHDVKYITAEQRVLSLEWRVAGTLDGDVLISSCEDLTCACQPYAPFKDKRVVLDLKTSNNLYSSYLAQANVYWKCKVEEFPETKFDGVVILRLGKDNKSEFEPVFFFGDEAHERHLLYFKRALDFTESMDAADKDLKDIKDAVREKARLAKYAAMRLRCPKADDYKGMRKSKCFDDGSQCEACAKIYQTKLLTK